MFKYILLVLLTCSSFDLYSQCNREADSSFVFTIYFDEFLLCPGNGVWDTSQNFNTWKGLKFDEEGCLSSLDLSEAQESYIYMASCDPCEGAYCIITKIIPPDIGDICGLRNLDLSGRGFEGELPANLAGLENLEVLDLSDNSLSGPIPSEYIVFCGNPNVDFSGNFFLADFDNFCSSGDGAKECPLSLDSIRSFSEVHKEESLFACPRSDVRDQIGTSIFNGILYAYTRRVFADGSRIIKFYGCGGVNFESVTIDPQGELEFERNVFDRDLLNVSIPTVLWECDLQDNDGDNYTISTDCDDTNSNINPSQKEVFGNNIDENCDGIIGECSSLSIIDEILHPSCYGVADGSILVTLDNNEDVTFLWSNDSTTKKIDNLISGGYSVTITDKDNCTSTFSYSIVQPQELLVVNVEKDIDTLSSATVIHEGGTAPFSYLWSDGQSTQKAINLTTGNYLVIIWDSNGCETLEIVSISTITDTTTATIEAVKENIRIYPNPVRDELIIEDTDQSIIEFIQIVSMKGETVFEKSIGAESSRIGVGHLPPGIYSLILSTEGGLRSKRVVIFH